MKVKIAAIQMDCTNDRIRNINLAVELTEKAASEGANVILLPELFERQYFCQERRYDYYTFAEETEKNLAVRTFMQVALKRGIVVLVSFYEKDVNCLYNSLAVIDADGTLLGVYRKTHIPDDHFYQEKFYFTPGNTGFKVWDTRFGKLGVGICWDQWFPETARSLALAGADLIFFPTAIGSEPILGVDSMKHWRRTMQGHAAANITPVIAANRYGTEKVEPCEDNSNQSSSLTFYGSSFMTDETGEIICEADREGNDILLTEYDLEQIRSARFEWGLFRDRRPECYKGIAGID